MNQSITRRPFIKMASFIILFFCSMGLSSGSTEGSGKRPNILFLIIDDLRPQLNCYGHSQMITPNIDRLAGEGVVFSRAYCQVPVCGASRASLFTGIRPTRSRFKNYYTRVDEDTPNAITLFQYFKKNGYHTAAYGKVFHHNDDSTQSWTQPHFQPPGRWRDYQLAENIELDKTHEAGPPFECIDADDSVYRDGKVTDKSIEDLERLGKTGKPFFLAVGLVKPHLPFNAPKKYWDLYPLDKINLADNAFRPKGAPNAAFHNWGELRDYYDIPKEGPLTDEMARKLIQGYYACTSYADAQVGRLLDCLESLGLRENTIIVLLGDHGWNLGEHTLWCKHCNFDTSLRTPLIVSAPGLGRNQTSNSLIEFIDVYPTLCELAQLEAPAQLHGKSLIPVLKDPVFTLKDAVFSRYHSGESVRTDRYLYTEWINGSGKRYARMLYDHQTDPFENTNIAESAENTNLVAELSKKLKMVRE